MIAERPNYHDSSSPPATSYINHFLLAVMLLPAVFFLTPISFSHDQSQDLTTGCKQSHGAAHAVMKALSSFRDLDFNDTSAGPVQNMLFQPRLSGNVRGLQIHS